MSTAYFGKNPGYKNINHSGTIASPIIGEDIHKTNEQNTNDQPRPGHCWTYVKMTPSEKFR